MARKLALVLATCLGLLHPTVFALGLGDISVDSALNQPFSATIQLRNTEQLERNEILANLASPTDFERIGVERFFFLSDLSFVTDLSDPARPVVRVSSSQPMTEPFVNFVIEVLWPSGRLLKEFTVLLDPPTYAARPLATPRAPVAAATPAAPARRTPAAAPAPPPPPAAPPAVGVFEGDRYGATDRDDTLWAIALRVRPSRDLSVHQTMLALLRLNPEAFIGGNINQLKAGYVLRVPDADEIRRLSYQDAIVQVAEQNDRWRARLDGAPLDARSSTAQARPASPSGGELRLVSGSDRSGPSASASSPGASGTGDGPGAGGASSRTAPAAGPRLAETEARNRELEAQLGANASEVQELRRQLEVRDEQIARLQEAVRQQLDAGSDAPPAAAPAQAASGGLFGFSWMLIAALVAGVLLIGVVVLLVLRRVSGGQQEETAFNDTLVDENVDKTQLMPAVSGDDLAEDVEPAAEEADVDAGEGEDVIAEADVYMAYGNFSEAAAALRSAMDAEPQRADIRLKLLEVHVEQGDVDAFNEQAFALQGIADEATIAHSDRLAARLPGAATSTGEIVAGDAKPSRETASGEVSLDFDLDVDRDVAAEAAPDLDSLDIDLDLGEEEESGSGIDFDLDLDGDDDLALDVAGDDDLGLDLGDDDDLALDLAGDDDLDLEGGNDALDAAGKDDSPAADDPFELSLEDEDDDGLPDIDFDLGDAEADADASVAAEAPAPDSATEDLASAVEDELDFDVDDLAEPDAPADSPVVGMTSESAPDFANRTVVLGADELETAMGAPDASADPIEEAGDALDFDIDDLASPDSDADSSVEASLDLAEPDAAADGPDTDEAPAAEAIADVDAPTPIDGGDDLSELAELTGSDGDELDFELDEDFDFGDEDEADEITTKLELARAYVDMGDEEGAREILDEVARDGDDGQKVVAGELLEQLG